MFGDLCHGLVLFSFGAYLCLFSEKIKANKNSSLQAVLPARYLLVLMGFFASYNGLIYNDFTSVSYNFFNSCYKVTLNPDNSRNITYIDG